MAYQSKKLQRPSKSQSGVVQARPIQTTFYEGPNNIKRINRAGSANRAVLNSIDHMQLNHYGATHCEVFDERDGMLHAVIKRHIGSNRIEILYQRTVVEGS